MKSMKYSLPYSAIYLLISIMLLPHFTTAQIKVTRVDDPAQLAGKNGIIYSLPRTLILADICVSKNQQFAGPLAQFAAEFMGIDEVITKDAVSYSIENASIRTLTEPDPGEVYLIEKEDKSQQEVWISFGKESQVMSMETFDKTLSPDGFSGWNKDLFVTGEPGRLFLKYTDSPTREVTDTVTRKVSIDTLVYEEKIFRHSREEYSDREKAQDAADKIRQIDHDIYNLLIGYPETAYSREALEYMVDKLEGQKLEYLRLFTGVTIRETLKFSYPVIPEAAREKQEYELADFTKTSGMAAPAEQNTIILTLSAGGESKKAENTENTQPSGLVYLMPVSCQAVITYLGKELASKRIGIMQLGPKLALPPTFKKIEINLETGGLRSVVLE